MYQKKWQKVKWILKKWALERSERKRERQKKTKQNKIFILYLLREKKAAKLLNLAKWTFVFCCMNNGRRTLLCPKIKLFEFWAEKMIFEIFYDIICFLVDFLEMKKIKETHTPSYNVTTAQHPWAICQKIYSIRTQAHTHTYMQNKKWNENQAEVTNLFISPIIRIRSRDGLTLNDSF